MLYRKYITVLFLTEVYTLYKLTEVYLYILSIAFYNKQTAKAVKELKIGDVIMWNYGYTSTVVDLIPSKTGKTIACMLKSNQDGVIRERKMSAERLVAIA